MFFLSRAPRCRVFILLVATLVVAAAAMPLRAQSWGQYGVTVYQVPNTFAWGGWFGISTSGQIGGAVGHDAAIFTPGSGVTTLPSLGGSGGTVFGVNNVGQATGRSGTTGDAASHAARWTAGTAQDLGALSSSFSEGLAINDAGQVVGAAVAPDGHWHAFRWVGGSMQDLGTLGGLTSYAAGINTSGDVVGYSRLPGDLVQHAALWTDGGPAQDLGSLGGSRSFAFNINDAGQIVGYSYLTGDAAYHAMVWDGGVARDVGTLGGVFSEATGIDATGRLVGWAASDGSGTQHGAVWESTGASYQAFSFDDILAHAGDPGWQLGWVRAISADGRYVAASGVNTTTGFSGTVILEQALAPVTTTPEPASLTLLATGIVGIAGVARRKRSARLGSAPAQ